jgi:protein-tyrosine phosphatase
MLTCLEEYSRVKCAQYWPQAGDSDRCTGPVTINVGFVTETRYSDYIVRELSLTVTKAGSPDGEQPSPKRMVEKRRVLHYHYLQWKDFNAPEHAPAMLK